MTGYLLKMTGYGTHQNEENLARENGAQEEENHGAKTVICCKERWDTTQMQRRDLRS